MTFSSRFESCMSTQNLHTPSGIFDTVMSANGTAAAIQQGIAKLGASTTISELVGAGILSDAFLVVGSVGAAYYAGALVGCAASAAAGSD